MSVRPPGRARFGGRTYQRLVKVIRALLRRFDALRVLEMRYRQAVSSARFQMSTLRNPSARTPAFGASAQSWRRSPIVRFVRRWGLLAQGAYILQNQVFTPLAAFRDVLVSLVRSTLHVGFVLIYCFQITRRRYAEAAKLVDAHTDGGRRPVLLFADHVLSVPELAQFAAVLEQQPQHAGKVAVVVPNSTVEAALRPLAASAMFINMQQFWLDQTIDIANHDLVNRVLDIHRSVRDLGRGLEAPRDDLFEAMFMDLHVELVQILRLGQALQAAFDGGKATIAICYSVSTEQQWFYQDFLKSSSPGRIATLATGNPYKHELLHVVATKPSPSELVERARARLSVDSAQAGQGPNESNLGYSMRIEDRDPRAVALVSDSAPGTNFWPTVANLALAAKQTGRSLRVLGGNPTAAQVLRRQEFLVDEFSPAATNGSDERFNEAYAALIEELDATTRTSKTGRDAVLDSLWNHVTLNLLGENGYSLMLHSHRIRRHIEQWMIDCRIGSVVVLPHWGHLAWAAVGAANALGIPSASTPAVSVAGNSASIVGWNRLSLVGCYGQQCRDAFISQGYPSDRLRLTGSLALDRALQVSRKNARERLKVFGALASGGRRILLYATSGVNRDEQDILDKIVEFCRDPRPNAVLVVRPHPSIGRSSYEEAISKAAGFRWHDAAAVIFEGTAHDNIAAADIVITDFSTIGAEAVLIGRPLLVVNTTGKPFPANNYADLGVAAQANSPDEVGPTLQRLLDEGAFWPNAQASLEAFTKAYNWGGDGQAGARLLGGLEELARGAQARAAQPIVAADLPV